MVYDVLVGLVQVKLDLSCLQGIKDDMDFCCQLAKEELVILLPGTFLNPDSSHAHHLTFKILAHSICSVQFVLSLQ